MQKTPFIFSHGLVRSLPGSFLNCLTMTTPTSPINLTIARQQHEAYVKLLRSLVPSIVNLSADERYPDCCFIEDTAIVVGTHAIVCKPGAKERQGEESIVKEIFQSFDLQVSEIETPGLIDGGDVLVVDNNIFVGLSQRTNTYAIKQLENILGNTYHIYAIPVKHTLHLKSVISAIDHNTLLIGESLAGKEIKSYMQSHSSLHSYELITVPDAICANILRIGNTVIMQDGFPNSTSILNELCQIKDLKLISLSMTELIKADGALTCCSILF